MSETAITLDTQKQDIAPHVETRAGEWSAVFAMSLCIFVLIASEFMPVSLLTPIAGDLRLTEGEAGQAISVSGALAVLTSLFIATLTARLDRKLVLIGLTNLMLASGAIVALAPNYPTFMIGRALLGIVIGGFWSMSAATAMRLVAPEDVPKAFAIFNGGNALATVLAAPLGSFLGAIIGWRGAFFCVVPLAAIVLIWQWLSLPLLKPEASAPRPNVFGLLTRPVVALGMLAVSLFFMGQFTLFTYLRPFLETAAHVDVTTLSLVLLTMGIAGFIGTAVIGTFLKNGVYRVLVAVPLAMALIAAALIPFGANIVLTTTLLAVWGLLATAAPVGWWMWISTTLPRDAEAGGGLMVAVIQLAITFGAVVGGLLFDTGGHANTFSVAALLLIGSTFVAIATARLALRPSRLTSLPHEAKRNAPPNPTRPLSGSCGVKTSVDRAHLTARVRIAAMKTERPLVGFSGSDPTGRPPSSRASGDRLNRACLHAVLRRLPRA